LHLLILLFFCFFFSEEAVESGTLDVFLRQNEDWKEFEDEKPPPEVKPIGVAGAYSPLQMNPSHRPTPSPGPSPSRPLRTGGKEIDVGEELSGFGLEGVKVTEQDLMDLVSDLIGEEDAGDLLGLDKNKVKQGHESDVRAEVGEQEQTTST
jgi:SH3 domain-binding glutamic acid-rich protein